MDQTDNSDGRAARVRNSLKKLGIDFVDIFRILKLSDFEQCRTGF